MKQKLLMLLTAAIVLGLSACEKDPILPAPITQQPNHLPENARLKQIKYSENDHLSVTYDAHMRLTRVRSQWQYVENDPTKIRVIDYDFQYDAQDRPTKITYSGGFVTNLHYDNQLIEKAQELYPGGDVLNDFTFLYYNKRIIGVIRKIANAPGEAPTTYKYELGYDATGNLYQIKTLELLPQPVGGSPYKLLETTTYSDFDDHINPTHWLLQFPWLPQVRWQFNNPRRMTIKTEGGSTRTYSYDYTYNEQGLPIEKRETAGGITKTAFLIY